MHLSQKQPKNQPIGRSYLECLIKPLFWQVCTYLSLDTNCASMPILSRAISQMFDPSRCCAGFVSLTVPDQSISDPSDQSLVDIARFVNQVRAGRIPYVKYASRLSIACHSLSSAASADTASSLHAALRTGFLRSLCLIERLRADENDQFRLSLTEQLNIWMFSDPSVNAASLVSLWLDRSLDAERFDDWSGLEACTSLRILKLVGPPVTTGSTGPLTSLIDSLPASLEHFVMASDWPMDVLQAVWSKAFSSPAYLPLLRLFRCERWGAPLALGIDEALATTVMTQTGVIRPIENWTGLKDLTFIQQLPLRHVVCRRYFREEVAEQLLLCPPHLWPHLNRLDIFVYAGATDVLPLLTFACHRKLTELRVFASSESAVIPLPQSRGLSDDAVQALALMSSLRALQLTNGDAPLVISDDLSELISINCWPELKVLELECGSLSERQLGSILAAAPNCSRVKLSNRLPVHSNALLLAMVLHYFSHVQRVQIMVEEDSLELDDLREAFGRYPLIPSRLQRLVSVELGGLHCSENVLHHLISHLQDAPVLSFLDIPSISSSPLALATLRALPHLRCVHQIQISFIHNSPLCHDMARAYLRYVTMQQFGSPLERLITYGDSLLTGNTFDEIVADRYSCDELMGTYVAFKLCVDDSERNGRELFFESVYRGLNEEEQMKLNAWDLGKYEREM